MKKVISYLLIISSLFSFALPPAVYAQEEEEDSIAEEAQDAIERIKDAVASRVAELNLVEKRGLYGEVVETSNTELTITDEEGNQRIIEIDELTRFEGERQSEDFGISDIETGSTISAVGLYNKDTEKLLARFITQNHNIPQNFEGVITEVDEDNFTITVTDENGANTIVDIETSTDTSEYADEELSDSGFSNLSVGQRAIVTGFASQDEENRVSAERVLHFTSIPPSPEMQQHFEETSVEEEQTEETEEE